MAGDAGDNKPWESPARDIPDDIPESAVRDMPDNVPKRAVRDMPDNVSKSVRDTSADSVGQAKSFVDANVGQFKGLLDIGSEQAKELTSTARVTIHKVGQQALNGLKDAVRPVVQVFEKAESKDGTELRKQISSVRMQLNDQLHTAQVKLQETQKATDEQLVPVRAALADAQIQLMKVNAFRREHPEAAAAGLIAVVGLPSLLLRGKIVAARNVLVAVGGGAAIAYGSDRLAAKKKKN